ncbi:hypothetical protein [Cupriavidus necator]
MERKGILSGFSFSNSEDDPFAHLRLGKKLGEGTSKTCYELLNLFGRPNGKVLLLRKDSGFHLGTEDKNIKDLERVGIPVARFTAIGKFEGKDAAIMEQYPHFFKLNEVFNAPAYNPLNNKHVTEDCVRDVIQMMDVVKKKKVAIWDIQFAVKEGRLHVIDPQGVYINAPALFSKQTYENFGGMLEVLCKQFPHMRPVASRSGHLPAQAVHKALAGQADPVDLSRYHREPTQGRSGRGRAR